MICKGELTKSSFIKAVKFVTENDREIFFSYKNEFAPNKFIISGCEGKYNYIGIADHKKGSAEFDLTQDDRTVLKVVRGGGLSLKAEVINYSRDFDIKFNIGIGNAKLSILENKNEIATFSLKNKAYTLKINDDENPTLIAAIIIGVASINKIATILFGA